MAPSVPSPTRAESAAVLIWLNIISLLVVGLSPLEPIGEPMITKCLFMSELFANRPFMSGSCGRNAKNLAINRRESRTGTRRSAPRSLQGSPSKCEPVRVCHQDANPSGFVVKYVVKIVVWLGQIGFLGFHPAADRNPSLVHGLGASRHKSVPPIEIVALGDEPVGAGLGQPGDGPHVLRRQPDAVRHARQAVGIVRAAAFIGVEQPAADTRPINLARILVLELG